MRCFGATNAARSTRSGARFTRVWLSLTIVLCACQPTGLVVERCRADRECPTFAPFCACDGLCRASASDRPDAGANDAGVPSPLTVVVARVRTFPTNGGGFGVDLDERIDAPAGSCLDQPDLVSALDGDPGVDNQFIEVAGGIDYVVGGDGWDGALAHTVIAGAEVLALEVTADDASGCRRHVHAWTARIEAGPVARDIDCAAAPVQTVCDAVNGGACFWPSTGGCFGIRGGQTWRAIDDLGEVDSRTIAGRLRTAPFAHVPLLPTIAPRGGTPVLAPLDMQGVVLEADVGEETLLRGELGGVIAMSDLEPWGNTHVLGPAAAFDDAMYRSLFAPDLAPDAEGVCQEISAGFGFETVSAILLH